MALTIIIQTLSGCVRTSLSCFSRKAALISSVYLMSKPTSYFCWKNLSHARGWTRCWVLELLQLSFQNIIMLRPSIRLNLTKTTLPASHRVRAFHHTSYSPILLVLSKSCLVLFAWSMFMHPNMFLLCLLKKYVILGKSPSYLH